ncbi:MAG: acyl-ACP--UDP-N-acetylglucosamine O-acyltransferase [Prolixibacteraceae bacterium]|jgi:UDP-N-acetylglucosamine acyltransferase|nr:acyl-ACP--UDP-N-acetylglucosamine O-acyltransferase [Prolixibacteraceae bacterium]
MKESLAYIHPDAKIGQNVTIEPFATIYNDVVIGDGTYISSNVTILPGTRIGKNCKIHSGAVLGGDPQDLKYKGEYTTVEIGDNNTIREFVTINRGTSAAGKTVVGNNCLIMAYSHIAHDCVVDNHVILANSTQLAGEVHVFDWAILGGGTLVHQFCHIGEHVMVSGGSRVGKDIPPFVKAGREPLSFVGVNSIGLRRRQFSNDQIREIQDIYRFLYQKGYNNKQALEIIATEVPQSEERDMIMEFVKNSHRGVIKGYYSEK